MPRAEQGSVVYRWISEILISTTSTAVPVRRPYLLKKQNSELINAWKLVLRQRPRLLNVNLANPAMHV